MGRRSEAGVLLRALEGSELARERVKVVLLTLGGQWSVKEALERLALSRTRFQDLRRRMLEAALCALEPGPVGRPPAPHEAEDARVSALERRVRALAHELRLTRTRLELAEGPAAAAVRRRVLQVLHAKGGRRQ